MVHERSDVLRTNGFAVKSPVDRFLASSPRPGAKPPSAAEG